MTRVLRNVAESVRTRLLNLSRKSGEAYLFVLRRYAGERFLYRLGESAHRTRFVLKGAMLLPLWGRAMYRPTHDLDFAGYGSTETPAILAAVLEVCATIVPDDGLVFDPSALVTETIRKDTEYLGLRLKFRALLGRTRIPVQIDFGFGDAIEPPPDDAEYPVLLDAARPKIRVYPREAVIAEKLHAMIELGNGNTRLKDFYDLYTMAGSATLDGARVLRAIAATFRRRGSAVVASRFDEIATSFFASNTVAWRRYLTKNALSGPPADFEIIGGLLRAFLGPPWRALAEGLSFDRTWPPGGPWGVRLLEQEARS
jgi:hypothetical protein